MVFCLACGDTIFHMDSKNITVKNMRNTKRVFGWSHLAVMFLLGSESQGLMFTGRKSQVQGKRNLTHLNTSQAH
jgi:hypothetical protein